MHEFMYICTHPTGVGEVGGEVGAEGGGGLQKWGLKKTGSIFFRKKYFREL